MFLHQWQSAYIRLSQTNSTPWTDLVGGGGFEKIATFNTDW